jgi:hypothetical protein
LEIERPASNDQIHIRDLLERLATNLPPKPSEVRNSVTGARVLRRPPRALLTVAPAVEPEPEDEAIEDEVEDEVEDDVEDEEEVEVAPVRRRIAAPAPAVGRAKAPVVVLAGSAKAERNRLLQRALQLVQEGRDPKELAARLERRADRDLAETFSVAVLALSAPVHPLRASRSAPPAPPQLSLEAEEEIARYAVGDETGVRAKLERTAQRAARESARVQAFLENKARMDAARTARGDVLAPPAPPAPPALRAPPAPSAPLVVAPVEVEPVAEAAAKPKPRTKRTKLEVVRGESVG